jgi:hypothetical protein
MSSRIYQGNQIKSSDETSAIKPCNKGVANKDCHEIDMKFVS